VDAARPEVLYSLMEREFHIIISKVEEKVTAVLAGAEDTQILNIAAGAPMLQIERIAFDLKGRPIEFRVMRSRNEAYYFSEVP
jgi:GntR family transcriptional regulator